METLYFAVKRRQVRNRAQPFFVGQVVRLVVRFTDRQTVPEVVAECPHKHQTFQNAESCAGRLKNKMQKEA